MHSGLIPPLFPHIHRPFLHRLLADILLTFTVIVGGGIHNGLTLADETSAITTVPSPADHLQRPIGTDFKLADWDQVSSYYRLLAKQSDAVELINVGQTTEGRDFLAAVISSPENLARMDEIKSAAATIADPRHADKSDRLEALKKGCPIVFITPTMHASEVAATEMGMQLSWLLATSNEELWRSSREKIVTVILPSLNPDGVDLLADWNRKNVEKPYEGTSLPRLYQKYTGHDNNRDWFALTQKETRLLTRMLYHEWHPQVLWDVHQQGNSRERFFVPPYRDPLNANIEPVIVGGMNLLGSRAVLDMTRQEFTGIATGVSYDNWWNGGNRSVPARHNIIGILTEAASVNLTSPIFQQKSSLRDPLGRSEYGRSNQFIAPWPGGWWRLSDIIEYELAFARSLYGSLNREPGFWLVNRLNAAETASTLTENSERRAWLVTRDNPDYGAVARLLDVLLLGGVEIHVSQNDFQADGKTYEAGTLVIRCDQPNSNYVNDLFEYQQFPQGASSYDVTGWTLPALFGLNTVEVIRPFEAELEKLEVDSSLPDSFVTTPSDVPADAFSLIDTRNWKKLVQLLQNDQAVAIAREGKYAGYGISISEESRKNRNISESTFVIDRLPRIGLYAPWDASMDEGWLRWTLEFLGIPYERIRNERFRAGHLEDDYDVIILPDVGTTTLERGRRAGSVAQTYARGLETGGAIALQKFVDAGGRLVAVESATPWVIDLFRLPLQDVTDEKSGRGFSCSGSVLRGTVEKSDPDSGETTLTAGLPDDIPLMFSNSKAWREMTSSERENENRIDADIRPLFRYASSPLLLSGRITKPDVIETEIAWARVAHGEGSIHLFGFRPYYRAWSHGTFHLLLRSLLLDDQ